MRANGDALGRYLGGYLSKDWAHRLPEDKGARCVRYFGHWSKDAKRQGERRKAPPNGSRFGWMTPRAKTWREQVKQVEIVARHEGLPLTEATVKELLGPKWAWRLSKLFRVTRFEVGEWQAEAVQLAIREHNLEVRQRWIEAGGDPDRDCWWHITEITPDHLRPSPTWKKQMEELELAKEVEAEILKRLRALEEKRRDKAEQRRLLNEAADSFQARAKGGLA